MVCCVLFTLTEPKKKIEGKIKTFLDKPREFVVTSGGFRVPHQPLAEARTMAWGLSLVRKHHSKSPSHTSSGDDLDRMQVSRVHGVVGYGHSDWSQAWFKALPASLLWLCGLRQVT